MGTVYILECYAWSENLENLCCSEKRNIRHVFETYEEAEMFAEIHAVRTGIPCKWNSAGCYAGSTIFDGVTEKGVCYTIHKGELH